MAAGELLSDVRIGGGSPRKVRWVWVAVGAAAALVVAAMVLILTLSAEPLANGTYRGADWSGRNLRGLSIRDSDLRAANLRNTDLSRARLNRSSLIGADLDGANLSHVELLQTVYDKTTHWPPGFDPKAAGAICLGPNVDLSGVFLRLGGKQYCDLRGLDLYGAKAHGATLLNADLRGANLSGADFRGADLSESLLLDRDLIAQRAPLPVLRQTAANLTGARFDAATRWPDLSVNFSFTRLGAKVAPRKRSPGANSEGRPRTRLVPEGPH